METGGNNEMRKNAKIIRKNKTRRNAEIMLLLSSAAVLFLSGCSQQDSPERLLADMAKSLGNVESADSSMNVTADMKVGTETVAVDVSMDMESTLDPEISHATGTMDFQMYGLKFNMDLETYSVKEDEEYGVYTKINDVWNKTTAETGEDVFSVDTLLELRSQAKAFELAEDPDAVNGEDVYEMTGDIDGDIFLGLMEQSVSNALGDLPDVDEGSLSDTKIPCSLYIYKESMLPARIYVDMKDVMTALTEDSEEAAEVSEFSLDITFTDYNSVGEINVPQEALEAAADTAEGTTAEETEPEKAAEQDGVLGTDWESYTVQLNDMVVTLPCTIADIEAAGLTLDREETPEDMAVNAGEYLTAYFYDESGCMITADIINSGTEAMTAGECLISGITVDTSMLTGGTLSVKFPGQIHLGDSLDKVLDAYGDADDIYEGDVEDLYFWYAGEGHRIECEMDIEGETQQVIRMRMLRSS